MAQDRITGHDFATRSEIIAEHGMAATSQPLATQVALDILKKGGNAIDAAIAANAVLGLVEPTGSGVGGDLFAIIWSAEKQQLYGLNASGRSPRSLTLKYFTDKGYDKIPAYGPLPVSVPGCVDGWFEMHGMFGTLPMEDILDPAINYARNGFPVSEVIAYYMQGGTASLKRFPNVADVYMPGGKAPQKCAAWIVAESGEGRRQCATKGTTLAWQGHAERATTRRPRDGLSITPQRRKTARVLPKILCFAGIHGRGTERSAGCLPDSPSCGAWRETTSLMTSAILTFSRTNSACQSSVTHGL